MNTENIYRLAAIIIILSAASISITFRHRAKVQGQKSGDQISAKREEQPIVFYLRSVFGTALWLSSLVYLINPNWMAWSRLPLPSWARWTGAAIGLMGIPLVYWVFSSLGTNVTHTTATRKQSQLVTRGPYRWVRHPLYTVGMINFIGFSLLSANWFILLTAAIAFTTILMRTPMEEKRLIERFGDDYREYMNITGRYLPRITNSR